MELVDLGSLAILGAVLSVLVQVIKSSSWINPQLAVVALSVLAGAGYFWLQDTALWQNALVVLGSANTVYLFLVKRFE